MPPTSLHSTRIVAKLSGHTRTTQTAQKIVWLPRKLKKIHHPIACPTNIPGRNRHKIHSLPFLQEVHSVLVRVTDTHQKTTPQNRTHRPFQSIPLRCHLGPRLACSRVGPTFARLRRRIVLTHHTGRRRPSSRSNRATSTSWVSLAPTVPIHPRPGVRLDTVFLSSCPAAALVLPPGPTWADFVAPHATTPTTSAPKRRIRRAPASAQGDRGIDRGLVADEYSRRLDHVRQTSWPTRSRNIRSRSTASYIAEAHPA